VTPAPPLAQADGFFQQVGKKAASIALAGMLAVAPVVPAMASEFDVLSEPIPSGYLIDDAGILNAVSRSEVNKALKEAEEKTGEPPSPRIGAPRGPGGGGGAGGPLPPTPPAPRGTRADSAPIRPIRPRRVRPATHRAAGPPPTAGYRVVVITLRKLEYDPDAFSFADKMVEKWYPTKEKGDKKGVLLVVSSSKEGALTGGPAFMKAVGDDVIDAVVGDNIPIFTEEEKYNEAVTSSVKRTIAALEGKGDIGGPQRKDNTRRRTYRTKAETEKARGVTSTIVVTLLGIAFVVPMLQYYGYVSKD